MNKFLLPILLSEILCSCTCTKLPMAADGIVRLSKIEVYPEYLEEYLEYAIRVGEISLRTEPGVLTMYAVSEKENPCMVTILETYASQAAYQAHISSAHFQEYKQKHYIWSRVWFYLIRLLLIEKPNCKLYTIVIACKIISY